MTFLIPPIQGLQIFLLNSDGLHPSLLYFATSWLKINPPVFINSSQALPVVWSNQVAESNRSIIILDFSSYLVYIHERIKKLKRANERFNFLEWGFMIDILNNCSAQYSLLDCCHPKPVCNCLECLPDGFFGNDDNYSCEKKQYSYVMRYGPIFASEIYHYLDH